MIGKITLLAVAALVAAPVQAKDLRDYCPERPGLDTPPCVVDAGHVSVETALADWTLERDGRSRTDTVLIGDTLVRVGVTDSLEAQIGWTPYGHVRERDRTTGIVSRAGRAGDMTLGFKLNLASPDGGGRSIAIDPFVTLPIGRAPVGAGDWGAGLRVPASLALDDSLSLSLTPEIDAAVDEDGEGRHLAYGTAAGLNLKIGKSLGGSIELAAFRDDDPSGHATPVVAALSLGWQPLDDLQIDIGTTAGLNSKSPDVEIYAGVSRRF